MAKETGLRRFTIAGDGFRHAVFARSAGATKRLRIYLDGDGKPFVGQAIAVDPTPRDSLALELLAEDPGPALYLGRPCYHGETGSARCGSGLWTRARYGPAVVDSMTAAVRRLVADRGVHALTLIGHSGGGTLAMLIAPRVSETREVVTIGADLDVAAWADYAREDLSGSLDPAKAPPLPPGIVQVHFAGSADEVVPPAVTLAALHGMVPLTVVEGFDHVCCWASIWPDLLAGLDSHSLVGPASSSEPPVPAGQSAMRAPITPP